MNRDFSIAFDGVIKSHGGKARFLSRKQLIEETVNSPTPQFYITEHEAYRIISRMLRNEPLPHKTTLRRQMYNDMFMRFKEWQRSNLNSTIRSGIRYVINSPAPRFYITTRYAINFFNIICSTSLS